MTGVAGQRGDRAGRPGLRAGHADRGRRRRRCRLTRTTTRAPGCRSAGAPAPVAEHPGAGVGAHGDVRAAAVLGHHERAAGVADHGADEQRGRHRRAGRRPPSGRPSRPGPGVAPPAAPAPGRAADRGRARRRAAGPAARPSPRPRPARPARRAPITVRRRAGAGGAVLDRGGRRLVGRGSAGGGPFGSSGAANMFTAGSSLGRSVRCRGWPTPAERKLKPAPTFSRSSAGADGRGPEWRRGRAGAGGRGRGGDPRRRAGRAGRGRLRRGRAGATAATLEHDLVDVPPRPGGAGRDAARPGRVRAAGGGAPQQRRRGGDADRPGRRRRPAARAARRRRRLRGQAVRAGRAGGAGDGGAAPAGPDTVHGARSATCWWTPRPARCGAPGCRSS